MVGVTHREAYDTPEAHAERQVEIATGDEVPKDQLLARLGETTRRPRSGPVDGR